MPPPGTSSPHLRLLVTPQGAGTVQFIGERATGGMVDTMTEQHRKRQVKPNAKPIDVPCRPLGAMLREAGVAFIDLFSLDVEGGELQVLETMDWSIPVRVWVVELSGHPQSFEKNVQIVQLMESKGYVCQGYFCKNGAPSGWDIKSECVPGEDCSSNVVFEHTKYVVKQGSGLKQQQQRQKADQQSNNGQRQQTHQRQHLLPPPKRRRERPGSKAQQQQQQLRTGGPTF